MFNRKPKLHKIIRKWISQEYRALFFKENDGFYEVSGYIHPERLVELYRDALFDSLQREAEDASIGDEVKKILDSYR